MAFEPIYEVAVLDGIQKLCSGQVVAEAKIVPPYGEEIAKILGVSASVDVATTEVFTGEARIKGRVDFKVLYSAASGQSRCLDYRAEFTDKITDDAITGGRPCAIAKVLDTDVVSASESEVRLAAVVETELFGQTSKRIKYLAKGGDNIYSHDKKVGYTKVVGEVHGSSEVTAEAAVNAKKIECVESRVCVSKAIASTNMVVFEGEVLSDVVYSGDEGVGHIMLKTPYSFEAEVEGAESGCKVFAHARLSDVKATIIEGEDNTLLVSYDVAASGYVMQEQVLQPVVDVFSIRNELRTNTEKARFALTKHCVFVSDEADGSVTLPSELPIVDNIVTPLGSSVILSNVYATHGKVTVEGLVRTNVVYFSGESNSLNSVAAELPFSISKPLDVSESDVVYATCEILGVSSKIRRGNEIDVRAELKLCITATEMVELDIITELSEGAEIVAPQSAISLHVASKKDTLWDLAKALCATPEAIMEQNPELSFPLGGGERIVFYRKLNK